MTRLTAILTIAAVIVWVALLRAWWGCRETGAAPETGWRESDDGIAPLDPRLVR